MILKVKKEEKAKKQKLDYKNIDKLSNYITDRGKVLPSRITGVSSLFQKEIKKAVKRARYMALLPFVADE